VIFDRNSSTRCRRSILRLMACTGVLWCGLSAQVQAYVFYDPPAVWPDGTIPIDLEYLSAPIPPLMDERTSWKAVAESALATWNLYVKRVQFTVNTKSPKLPDYPDGISQALFATNVFGQAFNPGVLGTTYTRRIGMTYTEADTVFNMSVPWNSYRGDLQFTAKGEVLNDLLRVATHEFGHSLGLDHPDTHGQVVVALMNSLQSNLESLAPDDIAGVQALYPPLYLSITAQPRSQAVAVGGKVTFSVVVSGVPPLSYQWQHNGGNISGATMPSFTISNVQSSDAGKYAVVVRDARGSVVTSDVAVLTVGVPQPITVPPRFVVQPQSQTVTAGQDATFEALASGNPPPTYQWYENEVPLPSATGVSLTLPNVQTTDAGQIYVEARNSGGSAKSQKVLLSVILAPTVPSITSQPVSQAVYPGGMVTFTVAASGSEPLSFLWYHNNQAIVGATAGTYTLSAVQTGDAGKYQVSVRNSVGSVTSNVAVLTVLPALTSYTDDFESGRLDKLPWTLGGNAPWQIETNSASSGRFAARSGVITNGQSSSLNLTVMTLAGTGSFDLRVSSELDWDNLGFYLNGQLVQRWSGEVGWRNYQFAIASGTNTLMWRYKKDAMNSQGQDAAYIDNLFLPMPAATIPAPQLSIARSANKQILIELQGQSSSGYVLQATADLRSWNSVATNRSETGLNQWVVLPTNAPRLFYRALGQ
jgi:hypothetical protein